MGMPKLMFPFSIQQQYPDIEETYTAIAERQYFENPFDLDACKETFEKALERFQNGKQLFQVRFGYFFTSQLFLRRNLATVYSILSESIG